MGKNRNKNSNNRIGSDAHSFKSENGKMNGKKKHGNKYHLNGKVADTIVEKMSVYKRPTVYPPQLQHYGGPRDRFCTPEDKEFKEVLSECYKNFYIEEESKFSSKFHSDFQKALEGLEDVYQFDLTQPGGLDTKVAKTYVSRCLVGDCGTTYKYLGLRMFSIPWTEGEVGASEHSIKIGLMNKQLSIRSDALITADCNPPTPAVRASKGSCDFNLTLINRFVVNVEQSYPISCMYTKHMFIMLHCRYVIFLGVFQLIAIKHRLSRWNLALEQTKPVCHGTLTLPWSTSVQLLYIIMK